MVISTLGLVFLFTLVSVLVVFVFRYSRETSLFTENLEFYLKQRTISHNQDKAKLAVYKTKLEKLEREMSQRKSREDKQQQMSSKIQEQEQVLVQALQKEVQELKTQSQELLKEKQYWAEENQAVQRKLEAESVRVGELQKTNQSLQGRLDKLKGQIRLVESQKEVVEAKFSDLSHITKEKRQEEDPTLRKAPYPRHSTRHGGGEEQNELQQLFVRDQVAQRFEKLLKEKAQKDYNDILSLEKEIIHLRVKFEGQSHAYGAIRQKESEGQELNFQQDSHSFSKEDLYQVQDEVTAIRSVVLNDIKPQMNQYMHELQGLAQRLRETRKSFFDNQLSNRAFESLSVEDVA